MDRALQRAVRQRANQAREYCRVPQAAYDFTFPIDHITAQQHGGPTQADNLALACLRCHRHQGPNLAGIDPETGELARLYHPRRDRWIDHFEWRGVELVGRTAIGRATIVVLDINHPDAVAVRRALQEEGRFSL